MCGFAGVAELDGASALPEVLRRMLDALDHRGPDGEGLWCRGAVALGHRRLAIIDPTPGGHQPMVTPNGRRVLAFNGCVYNYRELRTELEKLGSVFRTECDTEVVLQAYVQWGARCVDRFNGMFAIALWDEPARTLWLARDRYGIKPLYFAQVGETLVFASEIKGLLRHPRMQTRLCLPAFREYFAFQNILSEQTLFDGVRLLPAGSTLSVFVPGTDSAGARLADPLPPPERFWDFDFREDPTLDETTCDRTVRALVEQAVSRQLVGDVSVGSYLSGGIDSGAIAAVAAARVPSLSTFTCGFDVRGASRLEQPFDERSSASRLSRLLGTDHHEVVVRPADMERVMGALTWHLEEPRLGQSCPNYLVAQLARANVKVALSGAGGDELFAGYPWRYRLCADADADAGETMLDRHFASGQRLVPRTMESTFFRGGAQAVDPGHARRVFDEIHGRSASSGRRSPAEAVNCVLAFDARTFLHGLLLVEDKLAMAHGLEVRTPMLDNDLVDFATRIPVRHKLGGHSPGAAVGDSVFSGCSGVSGVSGVSGGNGASDVAGKLVLRRVFESFVPRAGAQRAKQGFSAPDATWFRRESADYVRTLLSVRTARIYDYVRSDTVTTLLDEHQAGQANHRLLIWSLMSMEWWLRTFQPTL